MAGIIIVSICTVVAGGFGLFCLIKLIMHFKEKEKRNKNIIRLVVVITLFLILCGLDTFLIIRHSYNWVKTGVKNTWDEHTIPKFSDTPYKPISEIPNAIISGRIETNFSIATVGNTETFKQQLNHMAYIELLRAAKEKYGDNDDIDIVDITWLFVEAKTIAVDAKIVQVLDRAEYTAMGKVIKYGSSK